MGKAALLLVAAAAIGGATLFASAQLSSRQTEAVQNEHRADVLAREAARSVHGLVLDQIIDAQNAVFRAHLGMPETFAYGGGEAEVVYWPDLIANTADFTVRLNHSGALHEIRSQYGWNVARGASFPSPLMFQTPWTSMDLASGSSIDGSRPVLVDGHRFNDLGLGGFLDLGTMTGGITSALSGSSSSIRNDGSIAGCATGSVCLADDIDELLGGQSAPTLFELYSEIMSTADAEPDRVTIFEGDQVLGGRATTRFGTQREPAVVVVSGSARLADQARVEGHGVLLVEGDFVISSMARLDWNGFILVVPENDRAEVRLDGTVNIRGALAVMQEGAPPGGHMDVSVWRDLNGHWTTPGGTNLNYNFWVLGMRTHMHTHRFDHSPGGRDVYFAENGRGRHENNTRFDQALRDLGSRQVYLEIGNPSRHGLTRFEVDVQGLGHHTGGVRTGWGDFRDENRSPYQSRAFRASHLRSLSFHVRSLRLLRQAFDESGMRCGSEYPICIANDAQRLGAMTLRLRDASNHNLLYETALYWHRKAEGHPEHVAEMLAEQQWRERILRGESFGTHFTMGDNATITFDPEVLSNSLRSIGFSDNGSTPLHLASWTRHFTPTEVALGRHEVVEDLAETVTNVICHRGRTRSLPLPAIEPLLAQGATLGPCANESGSENNDNETNVVCHSGRTLTVPAPAITAHLDHGDTLGPCRNNDDDDDDD